MKLYNIFIIKFTTDKKVLKYVGADIRPLNKVLQDIKANYTERTDALSMTLQYYGDEGIKINILEEVWERNLKERLEFWIRKEDPELNNSVLPYTGKNIDNKESYRKGRRRWGYQRVRKPKRHPRRNTIKGRCMKTGKIKTFHGWRQAALFVKKEGATGSDPINTIPKIKSAIARDGTAYGYYWWVYEAVCVKRRVYGVHKDGSITQQFESISAAMRACGGDDRGKGILTSIKWKKRWKGYMWHYADLDN